MDRKWISRKDCVHLKHGNIYGRELPTDFNPESPVWNKLSQHDISLESV